MVTGVLSSEGGVYMRRHKGFTLLEMLIVIITLGILSTVITLSVKNMPTTAEANNIINNMIMLRHATLVWYKENLSRMVIDSKGGCKINVNGTALTFDEYVKNYGEEILRHIGNRKSLILLSGNTKSDTGNYTLQSINNNKQWYVCYNSGTTSWTITNYGEESPILEIKKKLAGRVETLRKKERLVIKGKDDITKNPTDQYTNQKFMCMLILDFSN